MLKDVFQATRLKPNGDLDLHEELKGPEDGKKKKSEDKFLYCFLLTCNLLKDYWLSKP